MNVDVIIIGGGMVGLTQAIALAQKNLSVAVIEAKPSPAIVFNELTARVSAINLASIELLKSLTVWPQLRAQSLAPLRHLLVWDEATHTEMAFSASDLGQAQLGVIVENRALVQALQQVAQQQSGIYFFNAAQPQHVIINETAAQVELSDNKIITAALIIGADGANSWLRHQMNITTHERSYHQHAIICCVKTQQPHQATGRQVFLNSGPLALLPLHDKHHCAIVWSSDTTRFTELMTLDEASFSVELNNAFGDCLGDIALITQRQTFELVMRHAKHYVQPRLALIGDAAHSLHPLAGQGVNLGFADVSALTNSIDVTRPALFKNLRRYERQRKAANSLMLATMRGLRDVFSFTQPMCSQLRAFGMKTINQYALLKNKLMAVAMGDTSIN